MTLTGLFLLAALPLGTTPDLSRLTFGALSDIHFRIQAGQGRGHGQSLVPAGPYGKTVLDYVQDGLIAVWDGFENDGAGGHAETLTEWKDTSGRYSFVFNAGSGIAVDGSALVFPGTDAGYATLNEAETDATFELATNGTCEIVLQAGPKIVSNVAIQSSKESGVALGAWARDSADAAAKILTCTSASCPCPTYNWSAGVTTFATIYASAQSRDTWANAEQLTSAVKDNWGMPKNATYLGHRATLAGGAGFEGRIYAIRLYSKPLTPEQIAANRAVDEERFVKVLDIVGSPGDVVPVTPAYGEIKGLAAGTRFTCSAPAVWTNEEQNIVYVCGGYTVTTNGHVYLEGSDTSFTYTHPECRAGARLVWTWVPQDRTSSLYVQDGLIHQWDALENVGIGLSDRTASVWADLKGDVGLTLYDADTTWTSNSLHRTASTYVFASAAASIPGVRTLELTFKRSAWRQFAVLASLEGYVDNGRGVLTMKDNGLGSNYHGYHDHYGATHGDFVTVAFYPDLAKCDTNLFVNGEVLKANSDSEGWETGMTAAFALGGRAANKGGNNFCGDIYACRLYDRRLTPRELAKNAYYDGVRFNGRRRTDKARGLVLIFW